MADLFDRLKRSAIMANVKAKNTAPELAVRKLLYASGFRYRLHRPDLPGKPDIVLGRHRTVVFIHGCFWHGHRRCKRASIPKTRRSFWQEKLRGNKARDRRNRAALRKLGWRVITIWACELSHKKVLTRKLLPLFANKGDNASV